VESEKSIKSLPLWAGKRGSDKWVMAIGKWLIALNWNRNSNYS